METNSVAELGYIELGVSDKDGWQEYALEVLGVSVDASGDDLLLRMDDAPWRIKVVEGGEDDIRCAGFQVADNQTLQTIVARLSEMGVNMTKSSAQDTAARSVDTLFSCKDPSGLHIELFVGTRSDARPFESPQSVSGFVTAGQGLGHIVLFATDEAAATDFYQKGLGFVLSDHIIMGPPDRKLKLTFLHCNPRHHTLALVPVPAPKKLNHIMLEVAAMDDVGFALDRATAHNTPISSTLGRHTNDQMISFYMQTPSGFDIEYGFGGIAVDDATWEPVTYYKPSTWGHKGNLI